MKAELRRRVREAIRAMSRDTCAASAKQLCEVLAAQPIWLRAKSTLLFSPLADEPDISPLMEAALRAGKIIALPRFDAARAIYSAAQVSSNSDLAPGRFGALEPRAGCPAIPLNHLDLVLVPGIAFDLVGRRLGRGKGFYDRLLAEVRGHKCGVAFDAQIVAEIPEEPHDVRVDSIVTPTRWHLVERAA
jgi:5-formyltetrahydrofolate cyclo-ligase